MTRIWARIVTFRDGEASTAWLMFAYSFLAMSAYNVVKPITRSKFIVELGADNLPYVQLATGILIGLVMHHYSRATSGVSLKRVIPVAHLVLAAALLAFWPLFQTGATWVSPAFYVFGLLYGLLLISQFWSLADEIYDTRQARRLFGFIGGGASLGGAVGAGITRLAVERVGTANLLPMSAFILLCCTGLVWQILRRPAARTPAPLPAAASAAVEDDAGVDRTSVVALFLRSRQLQIVALLISCGAIAAGIVELQLNMAVAAMGASMDVVTRLLAEVTVYLSIAGLLVQVFLTSRLRGSLGLLIALLLLPTSLGLTGIAILLTGSVWAPAAARVLDTSMRYTVDKTSREVLSLPLSAGLKRRVKPFVDVTVDRLAKAGGSILLLVLIKPWGLALDWRQLSYVSLAVMVLWMSAALVARREYLRAFRRNLGARALAPIPIQFDAADPATVDALLADATAGDEVNAIYAVEMLDALGHAAKLPVSLLDHASPRVRAAVLDAIGEVAHAWPEAWRSGVDRLTRDPDPRVRAAALRARSVLGGTPDAVELRRHLEDVDAAVRASAAVELAETGRPEDIRAAEASLAGLVAAVGPDAMPVRREVAEALGRTRVPALRSLLVPLLLDAEAEVAEQAMQSAALTGAPVGNEALFVPALVARLGHRRLKARARATLIGYGDSIVDLLAHTMRDAGEQRWVRRHIPATLAHIPTERAWEALLDTLDDPDGFLRYKALVAIDTLRRGGAVWPLDRMRIEAHLFRECARYYAPLSLRFNLVSADPSAAASLIGAALDDKLLRGVDRVFRLLGLIHDWEDVAAARYSLEHGDARTRASALEYLDHLLTKDVRRMVMPIVDTAPMEDRVRQGNALIKARPRDLPDTLAQLVHDDDPVIAATALHYVVATGRAGEFQTDIEFVRDHRSDVTAHGAALWAMEALRTDAPREAEILEWPSVVVAGRLRKLPLFAFVSVDELFRIAEAARPVLVRAGEEFDTDGAVTHEVCFLLDGSVHPAVERTGHQAVDPASLPAPAVLNFISALAPAVPRQRFIAASLARGVSLAADSFMAMLTENSHMAQAVCRMVLDRASAEWADQILEPRLVPDHAEAMPVEPLHVARSLRQLPPLAQASVEALGALVGATRRVPIRAGQVLWDLGHEPAVYHLLSGAAEIRAGAPEARPVGVGSTIGLAEALTGTPRGREARVTRDGEALRLDQDELFDVLADHDDLLQGVFASVLTREGDR